jgi:hypothetical protein
MPHNAISIITAMHAVCSLKQQIHLILIHIPVDNIGYGIHCTFDCMRMISNDQIMRRRMISTFRISFGIVVLNISMSYHHS